MATRVSMAVTARAVVKGCIADKDLAPNTHGTALKIHSGLRYKTAMRRKTSLFSILWISFLGFLSGEPNDRGLLSHPCARAFILR